MVSTYTTNKNLELPGNGDYNNTWSTPVNADFTAIDTALGGATNLNVVAVSGTVTLTSTQYRPPLIKLAGALTANINYQFPSGVGGFWYVYNATSGSYTITFSSAGGGTSVPIPQGYTTAIISDGTNIGLGITTPAAAAGSNTQVQYNSSGVLGASSSLTWDGTSLAAPQVKINGNTLAATAGTATITFQNVVQTVIGRDTTDTLTNKTIDTAGTNTIKVNGNTLAATAGTATITFQNVAQTVIGRDTTDTLTNKTLSTSNTIDAGTAVSDTGTIASTSVGFRGIPLSSQTQGSAITLALTDAGKRVANTTGGWTIPANASVAFPTDTTIVLYNDSGSNQTISITSDTLRWAGTTSTGSRTLASYGMATLVKVSSTVWAISGSGLS